MTTNKRPIKTSDLEIGQVLPGNIVDAEDKVLFRQGLKLTKEIMAAWNRRGNGPYYLVGDGLPPVDVVASSTGQPGPTPYDPKKVLHIQQWFSDIHTEMESLVASLAMDEAATLRPIEAALERLIEMIVDDATLIVSHVITDDQNHPSGRPSLGRRSAYLAALAATVAHEYGLDHDECGRVAMAGLLHDIALFPEILTKLQDSFEGDDEKAAVVFRHGVMATDLLTEAVGIPDQIRVIINQLHEQMDGTGYPRGIPGHLINVPARLLNLTDAFLTLIAAASDCSGFVPGDAIACLIHHTSRGAFDRDCMRAFLNTATLYGIGTRVSLDDGRDAFVLRPIPANPLQPAVSICATEHSAAECVDLSTTDTKIIGPVVESAYNRRQRMTRSQINQLLWRPDQQPELSGMQLAGRG